MLIKLDIPDSQKFSINMLMLKDMWRKYGYREGKRIKPHWVENLMHEIDPYRYYLEWDIPELSISVIIDILKFLHSCPKILELPIVLPNGTKFIIGQSERAVQVYERLKEEI